MFSCLRMLSAQSFSVLSVRQCHCSKVNIVQRWCDSHAVHKTHNKRTKHHIYLYMYIFVWHFIYTACSALTTASQRLTAKHGIHLPLNSQPHRGNGYRTVESDGIAREITKKKNWRRKQKRVALGLNSHFLFFSAPISFLTASTTTTPTNTVYINIFIFT